MKFATGIPLAYRFEVHNAAGNRTNRVWFPPAPVRHLTSSRNRWNRTRRIPGSRGPSIWDCRSLVTSQQRDVHRAEPRRLPPRHGRSRSARRRADEIRFGVRSPSVDSGRGLEAPLARKPRRLRARADLQPVRDVRHRHQPVLQHRGQDEDHVDGAGAQRHHHQRPPPDGREARRSSGTVAWRVITHDDQVDTEGAEREVVQFLEDHTYLWEASWRNNFFNVRIFDGRAPTMTTSTRRARASRAAA